MGLLESALRQPLPRVPERLDELSALIDPSWINQALAASGKGSIRSRKLPAEHAVWLVIGLALFRNRPLWQVVEQLDLSLDGQPLPAPSASVQARQRLGEEPLAELSGLLTRAWNRAPRHVHGAPLRVLAVDGVVWPAPDTPDNREQLGSCSTQHGPLPWPQLRATCLMDARSHELLDAKLGGMACGELGLAAQLQGQDHSLTLFDRAYFSAAFLPDWQAAGEQRHWLMRAKDNLRHEVVEQFAPGDALIRMPISPQARKSRPELPSRWQARLIEVEVGGQTRRFITSMQDHRAHPARQLAELYRQRWEIELGLREIKQSLQDGEPVLRSKRPELVRQAPWGLIAHTLLHRWMREMAVELKVEHQRISFHIASHAIVNPPSICSLGSAGALPKQLAALLEQSRRFLLPLRRTGRSFPRAVKNRAHKFPTKKMPVSA